MFDCFKIHAKCKAMCCTAVPIPKEIYERNRHRLLRPVEKEIEFQGFDPLQERLEDLVVPLTKDCYCPFLMEDYRCGIQDDKPAVCKEYGSEKLACLKCPFQDKDGRERSRQETRKILRDAGKFTDKLKVLNDDH